MNYPWTLIYNGTRPDKIVDNTNTVITRCPRHFTDNTAIITNHTLITLAPDMLALLKEISRHCAYNFIPTELLDKTHSLLKKVIAP